MDTVCVSEINNNNTIQSNTKMFCANVSGPVATTLSNRFTPRNVVFCGGLVLGVSAILNGFAPNIYYLFLTHSVLSGKFEKKHILVI